MGQLIRGFAWWRRREYLYSSISLFEDAYSSMQPAKVETDAVLLAFARARGAEPAVSSQYRSTTGKGCDFTHKLA